MSSDSTKPPGWVIDDKFKPVDEADCRDDNPAVLANHMRALQREVRDGFEMIANRILPELAKVRDAIEDIGERLTALERDRDDINDRVSALERSAKNRRKAKK